MRLTTAILSLALAGSVISVPSKCTSKEGIEVPLTRRSTHYAKTHDGLIDLDGIKSEVAYLRTKYGKSFDNHHRNTGKVHEFDIRTGFQKRATGNIGLTDVQQELLWTGPLTFGTPPQTFQVDYDTGSADTLVGPKAYHAKSSSTSKDTGTTFQDSYGDGTTASGDVYSDVMTFGGLKASKAYIGSSKTDFVQEGDGIAGLAFPALSSFSQQKPIFYSLIDAGVLTKKAFVFKIRQGGGSLTLGATDPAATYVPVTKPAYWSVKGKINNQSISGIIDSGTTVIVAPVSEAIKLFKSLNLKYSNQQGQYLATYNCATPPSVSFTFGAKTINLGTTTAYGTDDSGNCVLSVIGGDVGSAGWIIGDPLFEQTTITFDVANQQVGFSPP